MWGTKVFSDPCSKCISCNLNIDYLNCVCMHMYSVTITCMGNSPKDVEVKQASGLAAHRSSQMQLVLR